jgi:release factor glutamine methyltransferase
VLIPRPETEHLVEVVLEELRLREGVGRVLDVGTGSGNIAVSVAVNAPDSRVDAMDSSAGALEVARRNARRHGVESRIRFIQATRVSALGPQDTGYRVVAANPPYVSAAEAETLMPDVRLHEPREALVDEIDRYRDGLGHYRVLAREGAGLLEAGGLLAVELGAGMLPMVVAEFESSGWRVDRVVPDLSGIDRVLALRVCHR